jgi:hypothetical protein
MHCCLGRPWASILLPPPPIAGITGTNHHARPWDCYIFNHLLRSVRRPPIPNMENVCLTFCSGTLKGDVFVPQGTVSNAWRYYHSWGMGDWPLVGGGLGGC